MTKTGLLRPLLIGAFALGGWTAGAAATAGVASACNVAPNSSCSPDLITVSNSATLVASQTGMLSSARIQGTYTEKVYRNPDNSRCANCLTWVLEINNSRTSQDGINTVTVSDFAGFQTDVGYTNSAPGMTAPSGGITPGSVSRSFNGSIVRWSFTGNEIAPGKSSVLLAIDTNSSRFKSGTVTVQDGSTDTEPGFAPQVPETPFVAGFGLLGGVAAGWYALRRRGQRKTAI